MVCIFPEKVVNKMLLFIVNLGHEEVKIIKDCTLAYLIPAKYDNYSDIEETNQRSEIVNISAETSGTKVVILPVILSNSNMIYLGDHMPVRKVLLQAAKI